MAYLEKLRSDKLRACGVLIQKMVRGFLARNRYRKLRRTVLLVQTYGRGVMARRLVWGFHFYLFDYRHIFYSGVVINSLALKKRIVYSIIIMVLQ